MVEVIDMDFQRSIVGIVTKLPSGSSGKVADLHLETDIGPCTLPTGVGHHVLKAELAQRHIEKGEEISVKFLGWTTTRHGGRKYRRYRVTRPKPPKPSCAAEFEQLLAEERLDKR